MPAIPGPTRRTRWLAKAGLLAATCPLYPGSAQAQSIATQVFETIVPFTYSRGRNESVLDRARPEFEADGVTLGGFTVQPSLTGSVGFTGNVRQSTVPVSSPIAVLSPRVIVQSNWSINSLRLDAGGNFVRYLDSSDRNENGWHAGVEGRLDPTPDLSLNLGARTARMFDNQFSGTGNPVTGSALPSQATLLRGLAQYQFTRVRLAGTADYTILNYLPVQTLSGTELSRDTYDRHIARVTAHGEYGVRPDLGLFVQATYSDTGYRIPLSPVQANRDSTEWRVLAGTSFDVTALVRGSLAVGYIDRRYTSGLYNGVKGLSFNGKVEWFPTPLTTATFAFRRDIEDSTIAGASGYFNTGLSAVIDHEFLRNLIVSLAGDVERDDFRGIGASSSIFRATFTARYMINRNLRLEWTGGYRRRDSHSALVGPDISEFRTLASLTASL